MCSALDLSLASFTALTAMIQLRTLVVIIWGYDAGQVKKMLLTSISLIKLYFPSTMSGWRGETSGRRDRVGEKIGIVSQSEVGDCE